MNTNIVLTWIEEIFWQKICGLQKNFTVKLAFQPPFVADYFKRVKIDDIVQLLFWKRTTY